MSSASVTSPRHQVPASTPLAGLAHDTHARSIEAANELLAWSCAATHLGDARGTEAKGEALRAALRRTGVTLYGDPSFVAVGQRSSLAPGARAVLALLGQDDDVVRLRAWASLAAATRWASACAGQPLDAAAFFGAERCERAGAVYVALRLAGTPAPLMVPVLNLVQCDWAHVGSVAKGSALSAAFGLGPLWQHLPADAGLPPSLAHMASTLASVVEQASPPAAKARALHGAVATLRRLAQLPSVAAILLDGALSDARDQKRTSRTAVHVDQVVSEASYARMAASESPAPSPAKATAGQPSSRAAVHRAAVPSLVPPSKTRTSASRSPVQPAQREATIDAVPPEAGAPSARGANDTRDRREQQAPSPAAGLSQASPPSQASANAATAGGAGPGRQPAARTALADVAAAEPEAAWALLDAATTNACPLAPHLDESQVLRLLAAPPDKPLTRALAEDVALWLRRLTAQPTLAATFVAEHPEALKRWTREEGLLTELGRLFGGRFDAAPPLPSLVVTWLARATAAQGVQVLRQALTDVTLQHPLYKAALQFVQERRADLSNALLGQFVGLTGQKLASKRATGEETRQRFEPALATLLDEAPHTCLELDFRKNSAWRVLSRCTVDTQRACLEMVLTSVGQHRPSGHAVAPAPAELLLVAAKAASLHLQLVAASLAFKRWPHDVDLARAIAALLTRNKKALTSAQSPEQLALDVDTLVVLIAPCLLAGEAGTKDELLSAQAVWQGLEAVGFGVPYFIATKRFEDAATVMHRAHANPVLAAQSLRSLAVSLPSGDGSKLTGALTDVLAYDMTCTGVHVGQLRKKAEEAYLSEAKRRAFKDNVGKLERRLNVAVEADQAWFAACATSRLLTWANKEMTGEALFTPDGAPRPELSRLFDDFAQRHVIAAFLPSERPIRRLVALLRNDAHRRAAVAEFLLQGIDGARSSRSLWAQEGLSLPVVLALVESAPEATERQRLAARFGAAFSLWPVVAFGQPLAVATLVPGDGWSVKQDTSKARAEAMVALLPTLVQPAGDGPPVDSGESRRARLSMYLEATIVHVMRDPEHYLCRLPELLRELTESDTLPLQTLRRQAREAMRRVIHERLDLESTAQVGEAVASGVMAAWSVCQLLHADLELALALVDGVCDAMDSSKVRQMAYGQLHAMLRPRQHVPHGEASSEALVRMRDAVVAQLERRTLGSGVVVRMRPEAPRGVKMTHLIEDACAPAPFSALQRWLVSPDASDIARGFASVVDAWVKYGDDDLLREQPIQAAIAAVGYACLDGELRAKVLLALAAHGEAQPRLTQALLVSLGERRPFSAAERNLLVRLTTTPGSDPVLSAKCTGV